MAHGPEGYQLAKDKPKCKTGRIHSRASRNYQCHYERYGRYSGIDEYLRKASGGAVETLNLYTIMENPMTSCGCFECILAIIPEANGVMIVHRGHTGMTPVG